MGGQCVGERERERESAQLAYFHWFICQMLATADTGYSVWLSLLKHRNAVT